MKEITNNHGRIFKFSIKALESYLNISAEASSVYSTILSFFEFWSPKGREIFNLILGYNMIEALA